MFFFLKKRRPPRTKRTDTIVPYTTLRRSPDCRTVRRRRVRNRPACRTQRARIGDRAARRSQLRDDTRRAAHRSSAEGHDRRAQWRADRRSEEHTSELQSLMRISYAVFCLKKKNTRQLPTSERHLSPE